VHILSPVKRWRKRGVEVFVLSERGGVSTGLLLRADRSALLVDCGDGIARDLADLGCRADELSGVVVTHDHADHCAGLLGLFWLLRLGGRSSVLPLHRPRRAALVGGLVALYREAFRRRTVFRIKERVMKHDRPLRAGPFTITSFPVRHRRSLSDPPGRLMEVHGLSIRVRGLRVVVSSDTGPSPRLAREVEGADLALIEATQMGRAADAPPDMHLTPAQAHALGRRAKAHLLYHRAF
jgi:ribonuclease BN (tRNA processing enzyme)